MNVTAGEALQVPRNLKLSAAPKLTDATQNEFVMDALPAGGPVAYRSPALVKPGVYHLATGTASLPIAVNVPPEEADVRTIENAAVKKFLGDVDIDMQGDSLPAAALAVNQAGNDFGWPFMLVALLFVAAECVMAMKFGHYRRT
jgi:hypothetical protein